MGVFWISIRKNNTKLPRFERRWSLERHSLRLLFSLNFPKSPLGITSLEFIPLPSQIAQCKHLKATIDLD